MARQFVRSGDKLIEGESPLPSIDTLVLGAHNDDEMFPGGHLIKLIKRGKEVGVVVATDGAGSNYQGITGQDLIDLRTEESREAIEALGGSFLIGYDYPSSHLKSDNSLISFADELADIISVTQPRLLLVQSPLEGHYTHMRTTEAGIIAARRAKFKPEKIWGYEVWTPLLGIEMVHTEPMDKETAEKKLELQKTYETQNSANPYPQATRGLNLFSSVMADTHRASDIGYTELFLDMSPLIHDDRFAGISSIEYGGGLLILTQVMRSSPKVQVEKTELSGEQKLDLLINKLIPLYREGNNSLTDYARPIS